MRLTLPRRSVRNANGYFLVPLDQVPYVDRPSIEFSKGESVEMPFKYVKGKDGKPVMPEVRFFVIL